VIGPTGTSELMRHLEAAYSRDLEIRIEDEKLVRAHALITTEEFEADGIVYEAGDLRIAAFTVDHGVAIKPAYGYRIEYQDRVAVISGDTRYNENVVKFGTGVDLLIHEVAMAPPELCAEPHIQRVLNHHTTPQEAGLVFARAKPKLGVYTHLVMLASASVPAPSIQDLIAQTRETYVGPLIVGEDLMSFEISDIIKVQRASLSTGRPP
jgi:ribonuclease Z